MALGHSDETENNGVLALYLDGVAATSPGAESYATGKLTAVVANQQMYIGTALDRTGVANGTFSYLTIRNAAGSGAEIVSWTRGHHVAVAPVAPRLLSPANAAATPRTATLSWSPTPGVVKYRVQVATSSTFGVSYLKKDVILTATSYAVALPAAGTYYWRVVPYDNYGSGAASTAWSFRAS